MKAIIKDAKSTIIEAYSELDKLFDSRLSNYKTYVGKDLVVGIKGAGDKKTCHMDIQREVFVKDSYSETKLEIHNLLKDAEKLVSKYEGMKVSDGETRYIGQKPVIKCDYNRIKIQFSVFILFKEIDNINEDIEDDYLSKLDIKSNGIYSINTGWLKTPVKEEIPDIDEHAFETEFKKWETKFSELLKKLGEE